MNPVAEAMRAILEGSELLHYGMPRRSGRYPYGSGEDPYQHTKDFLSRVEEMRKNKFTYVDEETGKTYTGDTAIAKSMGLNTTQFRTEIALASDERKLLNMARARSLKADGKGASEIGREMGVNESTVRSWLNSNSESKLKQAQTTANFIKEQIEKKGMIDVTSGVEREMNISSEKLKQSLYLLEREGYPIYLNRFEQPTNRGNWTTQKVICPKGTPYKDIYKFDQIHPLNEDNYISRDDGASYEKKFHYPSSMDSKRLQIRYKEDGGIDKDGIVELRRGVPDLSLGESQYSQVRILVDNTHYIKGMAVYSDDMPDGVDVIFNTNKTKDTPMTKVLKEIKKDPDNPFGSAIKDVEQGGQYWYDDKDGSRKLGLINKRADEGDWSDWADALPSQFLGKQSKAMAKKQLSLARADKAAEYEEICALTNPTIKKHLLNKFADECDSAAVHLKAAALPRQKYHVIIPFNTLKDNEIYAPNYKDGEKIACIRYPHGGTFEIPILTVNNKHAAAIKLLGNVVDAVGINKNVADRLSGADFDGDTVMCIPTHDRKGKVRITNKDPLKGLEGFDPKMEYPEREGMKYMKDPKTGKDNTQKQMGVISNLITDMTLAGATDDELAAAVRHSMVVIDAAKHKLDYKKSEIDNNIAALKKKYQPKYDDNGNYIGYGGAATLLSKSKGEESVDKRQGTPKVNMKDKPWYDPNRPEGALIYTVADDVEYTVKKVNKRTGEITETVKRKTQRSTKMAETDNAHSLVSQAKHPMELIYADYANSMKALANQARKEMMTTGKIQYNKNAAAVYSEEVNQLKRKVNDALLNAPRERAATRMAYAEVQAKLQSGQLEKGDMKKASQKAVNKYRQQYAAIARSDRSIKITDREWEAIQAGAISETLLVKILNNADVSELRQRATPRATTAVTPAMANRIKAMSASYTNAQIAEKLNISSTTVSKTLKGAN